MTRPGPDMTPEELRGAGLIAFGALWQKALSRYIGINARSVARWASGDKPMPPGLRARIIAVLDARELEIAAYAATLAKTRWPT